MNDLFIPQVGAVLSADIAVPEHEQEFRFYSRVLGTGDRPLWRGDDLMSNLGVPIIGLGARSVAHADLPLQWMPHIQVADVGSSVERAVRLGGRVLMHGADDAGDSQWAVLLDPNGAAFGIIPVVPVDRIPDRAAADPGDHAGRIHWVDLTIPNASRARDFYRQVIEWSVQDVEMKDGDSRYADYNMLSANGAPAAGICHARGANTGLPPVWMIYLPVGDLTESIRRAEEAGGRVIKAMRDGRGESTYAVIEDPAGACFALVQG